MQAMNPLSPRLRALLACGAFLLLPAAAPVHAQDAGEVEYARGAAVAQAPGQAPRIMGRGLALQQGDRLTTADGAMAVLKMQDGTRLTLRPNSELIMQTYRFDAVQKDDNSMVMQLLRGGFRAITGLITKGSSDAGRIQTPTATVGIRGTDFDIRVCGAECRTESAQIHDKARPNGVLASAKLVGSKGDIVATDGLGQRRALVDGGAIYPGDALQTGPGASTVLAFRDDSRLTLGPNSLFKVESFVYDPQAPAEGRFLVNLLRGSLRALTGLIGKANNRNVGFSTPTATIGIRGTGLDMDCADADACKLFTWLGTIEVTPLAQTPMQVLSAGQGLSVGLDGIRALQAPTLERLPRPDQVPVNMQQLFGSGSVAADAEGLYVFVRDGHIQLTAANSVLDLGRGETGYAGGDGQTGRPADTPLFIQYDTVPLPTARQPGVTQLLNAAAGSSAKFMCP